ncbi:hypothetical protein [Neglectibacter caecimuris]|uniref:hypothetical protein n=1 Tax=Neglectibacter caecimuris TaxID=3093658 RepID=UPI002AC9BDBA|nr:hypothetical protein [Neglectibacter sp. M00184]
MNTVLQNAAVICIILVATELASRLCEKDAMVNFVKALTILVLLTSFLASLFSVELDFSVSDRKSEETREELSGYVQEQTEAAFQSEMKTYLEGLFAVAGLQAEKIEVMTDIGEDSGIVLRKVRVVFAYASDSQRAIALLENTLGKDIDLEVQTDGR